MFKCAFFNPDHSLAKLHTLQSFTPGKYDLSLVYFQLLQL